MSKPILDDGNVTTEMNTCINPMNTFGLYPLTSNRNVVQNAPKKDMDFIVKQNVFIISPKKEACKNLSLTMAMFLLRHVIFVSVLTSVVSFLLPKMKYINVAQQVPLSWTKTKNLKGSLMKGIELDENLDE